MIDGVLILLRLLLGLGAVFLLGYAWFALLAPCPREFRGLERLALSFGIGATLLTLWMLVLTWMGLLFSLPLILVPPLALGGLALLAKKIFWREGRGSETPHSSPEPLPPTPYRVWDWVFLSLLAALFLFATLRAVLYPMWAWDAIATWGCKAKVFYQSRGLDLTCIDAHNYYPNLVPLLLSYLYFCLGRVNDHLAQGLFPLWGALLLALLYSLLRRLSLSRTQALGITTFFALNGTVFVVHLYIAYADLPLAYFTLAAVGLLYLWLTSRAPRGSLALTACFCAGMAWCKYEGPPLAGTILLAGVLTLAWLRPPDLKARLLSLGIPLAGLAAGYLPWRLFAAFRHLEVGADHIQNLYPQQFLQAFWYLGGALVDPFYFGLLWPGLALALIFCGKSLWRSPRLFPALFLGGNLLAILVAYGLAPTAAAEFDMYVRATLDRLLLHLTPVAALLVGEAMQDLGGGPGRPVSGDQ
ncbi:MAG: hypothetical protein A2Z73_02725 [Deltaproteobacteria bacterium RBG_13_60_28]|nr:MAG: hypothetical protein A2Z73_02725 [Deltaproteobacteria bacterium RBG_13_60_28]